jgi:NTE family protein
MHRLLKMSVFSYRLYIIMTAACFLLSQSPWALAGEPSGNDSSASPGITSTTTDTSGRSSFNRGKKHRPRVGVVLSGGGAKGLVHIGVLKVLEEAGMPVDYIGGTSIGSIIGGLYAIGYRSADIESIVLSQNWRDLLTDRVPREDMSADEKQNEGKYFFPYPVNNGKFQLPSGLIHGRNIELLLSRLMCNARDITEFDRLPIPFICVASDIERDTAIILRGGTLPRAIRASMAIPTVFTPVKIGDRLLVDGGLCDNFPVEVVKKMGADILIGVDVGFDPYHGVELNSMDRIVEQSLFGRTVEHNNRQRRLCTILLQPPTGIYGTLNFDRADSLIKIGERTARAQFAYIKKLADSLRAIESVSPSPQLPNMRKTLIRGIHVFGNDNLPRDYIIAKLNLPLHDSISVDMIEKGIMRLYGTMFFQKVDYAITHETGGDLLTMFVSERPRDIFSMGLNYNSDYKASVFFTTNIYNVAVKGSKLVVDLLLGENPRFNATYFLCRGIDIASDAEKRKCLIINYGVNLYGNSCTIFNYENGTKTASLDLTDLSASLMMQTDLFKIVSVDAGIQHEYIELSPNVNPGNSSTVFSRNFNLVGHLKYDTYDKNYFATRGTQFDVSVRYLTDVYGNKTKPVALVAGSWKKTLNLGGRLAFIPGVLYGFSSRDTVPEEYLYRIGGVESHDFKNAVPFIGRKFMQYLSRDCAIARCDLQYEIFARNIISIKVNGGRISDSFRHFPTNTKTIWGYGVAYGYNSLIGPVEVTLMDSPAHDLITYLNVGFRF